MRLLDRYLFRELMAPLGYCLGGFMIFWVAFNFFSKLDDFQERSLGFAGILEYYFYTMPELLVVVLPIALLLALLYALTDHGRHNELVAMRAAGVSIWRLSLPYFLVGFCFSIALFVINEHWLPRTIEKAEDLMDRNKRKSQDRDWERDVVFQNTRDQRAWHFGAINTATGELLNTWIIWAQPDGGRREIFAARGNFTNGLWVLREVKDFYYDSPEDPIPTQEHSEEIEWAGFSETPDLIRNEIKISHAAGHFRRARKAQLTLAEISEYLEVQTSPARHVADFLHTKWHARLAMPWTCLVVVVIALPFGAISGRRNVFVGVASSIFIAFSFFILRELSQALGTGGYVAPWLAAWMPNMLFATIGIALTLRVR